MFVTPFPSNALQTPLTPELGAAAVCEWDPGPDQDKALVFFTYRRTGRKTPSNQHGPRASPVTDVFGDWVGVEQIPPVAQITGGCDHPPQPVSPTYDRLPPSPGWPSAAQ